MRFLLPLSASLCTLLPVLLPAQSFVNSFGGPLAQDGVGVVQTQDGFAIGVRDYSEGPSRHYAQLLLTSNGGSIQSWDAIEELTGNVFPQAIANAPGDAVFLAGSSIAPGAETHDAFVLKRNANGTIAWIAQPDIAGDEQYFALEPLPDGGAVACGVRALAAGHDAWVSRFAADGTVLWNTAIGLIGDEEAYALVINGNDILLTGRQSTFSGTTDAWLARMDLDGNELWSASWGGNQNEDGRSVVALNGNGFLLAGTTNTFGMFDNTENRIKDNVYLVAFDLNGDTLWTRAVGDTLFDHRAMCIDVAPNGDILIGGERGEVPGESDALVYRLTANGDPIWERAWHMGKEDRLVDVLALPDGFISTGWSFTELARQVLLIRRDPDGN